MVRKKMRVSKNRFFRWRSPRKGEYVTDSFGSYGRCIAAPDDSNLRTIIYYDKIPEERCKDPDVAEYAEVKVGTPGSLKILPLELWDMCREKEQRCSDCDMKCHEMVPAGEEI